MLEINENQRADIINGFRTMANTLVYAAEKEVDRHSIKAWRQILKKLRSNTAIKVCNLYRKGNGTVILDSEEHVRKLDNIVHSAKFEKVHVPDSATHHPIIEIENSLQYYLNRYIGCNAILANPTTWV